MQWDHVPIKRAPERIVSLVPSITETLFDLGFGQTVTGRTVYCRFPLGSVESIPVVGGPKNPDIDHIKALQPDLVIMSRDENPLQAAQALFDAGIPVWAVHPVTIDGCLAMLWDLVRLFRSDRAGMMVDQLERTVEIQRHAAVEAPNFQYFYPIWSDTMPGGGNWWMTFNRQTYSSDLLALFGGCNIFAKWERRYPLEANWGGAEMESAGDRDIRYPVVTDGQIKASRPDIIILPDEPYDFSEDEAAHLRSITEKQGTLFAKDVLRVDGSLLFWYGSRLGKALALLPGLIEQIVTNTSD